MNNKIGSTKTKTTSTIFLAIVLVTGTIALSSTSFIFKGVEGQAQPYYDGMDDSYGPTDYGMDQKKYDSYGPTDYGMDKKKYDSYGPTDYGMDNNYDKKSYEKDNSYESQYSSYKADSKPKYTSYGKDDRHKSQKDSTTIIINNNFKKDVDKGDDIAQCAEDVETCFRQILSDDFAAFENELPITITIESGDSFTFENFEDFCTELAGLDFRQLERVINALIDQSPTLSGVLEDESERETLIECIAEALEIEDEV